MQYEIYQGSTEPATFYVNPTSATNTLKVTTAGGDIVTFTNLIPGAFIPVQIKHVWDTGTANITTVTALF
jgi:hypothetical protein